ncbi:MAG: 3-isopropylmalate dehydratase small subunit [Spirochaetia bacterium]
MIRSRIWKFGDNVDTDQIIASQYLLVTEPTAMLPFVFQSLDPEFAGTVKPGEIIVAGKNFGCGSSREQAALVLKLLGISVIIAHSFGRIFFRNCINIGLPLVTVEDLSSIVGQGDEVGVDLEQGSVCFGKQVFRFPEYPPHLLAIIKSGGLIEHINTAQED